MRRSWGDFLTRGVRRKQPSKLVPFAEFRERIQAELRAPITPPTPFSIIQMNVDAYGNVLHRRGIEAAADLLDSVTRILTEKAPTPAVVARVRVAELATLLPSTGAERARAHFEGIRIALNEVGEGLISTGIVTSLDHSLALPQVLQVAYQAMYAAQRQEAEHVDHQVIENLEAIPYRRQDPGSSAAQERPPAGRDPERTAGFQEINRSPRRAG